MKKFWNLILPLIIVILIGLAILRPGVFNMIPFAIHESCCRDFIKESNFIIGFDIIFLLILYLAIYKVIKKILNK
jgi:hypothetical protein